MGNARHNACHVVSAQKETGNTILSAPHSVAREEMGISDSGLASLVIWLFPLCSSPCPNLWNFPPCVYLFFFFLSAEENYTSASIVHHRNKHSQMQL